MFDDPFNDWVNSDDGPLSNEAGWEIEQRSAAIAAVAVAVSQLQEIRKVVKSLESTDDEDMILLLATLSVAREVLFKDPRFLALEISDQSFSVLMLFIVAQDIMNDQLWRDNNGYS